MVSMIAFSRHILILLFSVFITASAFSSTQMEWLSSHNQYRKLHGTVQLIWSDVLERSAKAWANSCPEGHSFGNHGENMFWASYYMPPADVVKFWYEEEKKYDYSRPGFSVYTGHFSQVIWKSTQLMGCGFYDKCSGEMPYIWVCHYFPPGNYRKRFPANVRPPLDMDSLPMDDYWDRGNTE